jgi:hypothetical protein
MENMNNDNGNEVNLDSSETIENNKMFWVLLDYYFDKEKYKLFNNQEKFIMYCKEKFPTLANSTYLEKIVSAHQPYSKQLSLQIYACANQEQKQYINFLEENVYGTLEIEVDDNGNEIETEKEYLDRKCVELKKYYDENRPSVI